ncbi:NADH-ubiquinone oxidoreductase-F iron-sulfur binding region domain-containing protein [Pseudanabaena yagii]|uniref:Protein disulfide oxidoreductase n=1 Tax=Pseudanabaena yagii GIHE-NHR1 TaxID=2722753 RepID=A0ABX1LQI8_9CYAN|nr:NADH-ubiquinone oxidoreductase-F iron-sulfur binding region domain-containing protein [Pseudanabaena yagii]NMF58382.1 protein disulfide oxidoreductase [Pseudanabaena yagii GIHE-NHR1]
MKTMRRYWETHNGEVSPLLYIHDYLRSQDHPSSQFLEASDYKFLAEKVGLPEVAVRGIISYYADLHQPHRELRVCQGTSCILAGAKDLQANLEEQHSCKGVYCLGYCDRSPAVLDSQERIFCGVATQNLEKISLTESQKSLSVSCLAPQPIITRRITEDYADLAKARSVGVYSTFLKALDGSPENVLSSLEKSGLRGRGGAGFPTGKKWRSCAEAEGKPRYVVTNGDEGDPGSFIDRVLMEKDPHGVLEGILLCGYAVGASQGIVFIRSEYPQAIATMRQAIDDARNAGIFGAANFPFEISVFVGMGSYVCGEETAMLNTIEGLRGEVQIRPPYPTVEGLYGKPTVVNNVETLVNVAAILDMGAAAYANLGTTASAGTKAMCLNYGFARSGIVEVEFGMTLRELMAAAGGSADGQPLEAILLGGPMGSLLTPEQWDLPICYGAMSAQGIQLGHGGLVALPQGTDYRALLEHWLEFMVDESCGKCVPCRLGSHKALNLVRDRLHQKDSRSQLERLFNVMEQGSLCAFGQSMPVPMRQMIEHFGDRIFS